MGFKDFLNKGKELNEKAINLLDVVIEPSLIPEKIKSMEANAKKFNKDEKSILARNAFKVFTKKGLAYFSNDIKTGALEGGILHLFVGKVPGVDQTGPLVYQIGGFIENAESDKAFMKIDPVYNTYFDLTKIHKDVVKFRKLYKTWGS